MEVLTILAKSHFWNQKRALCTENMPFLEISHFSLCRVCFFTKYRHFFRLVIKLFCGSFNDFGKIPLLGPKTRIYHFLNFHIFSNAGCISSQNIAIFDLQECYKVAFWKFHKDLKRISLGDGVKIGEIFAEKKTSLPRGLLRPTM